MKKTNKELSLEQENTVARYYGGRRSKSSGASSHDPGDVITPEYVIECKFTRGKSIPLKKIWEKITEETHTGRNPGIAVQFLDESDRVQQELIVLDMHDHIEILEKFKKLSEWATSMPDAGFNDQDPRWDWWHKRPNGYK